MSQPSSNPQQAIGPAVELHRAGKLAEAEREYRAILSTDEKFAPAWHLLGVLLLQSNRVPESIESIRRAIDLGLNGADAQSNLGEALRAANRFDEAIAAYQSAIKIDPNNPTAYGNLGTAYNEMGRFAEAIGPLNKSLSLRPNDARTLHQYGLGLRMTGEIDSAIEAQERALRIAPDFLPAMSELGEALHRSQRFDRAATILRRLIERYPQHAAGHAKLASVLASMGQFDEALKEAQKAVELEPQSASHYTVLGLMFVHVNRYEEAIAAYHKAMALDPKSHVAYANLGGLMALMNRTAEAVAKFERAVELNPDDSEIAGSLIGSYYIDRQPQKALDAVDQAIARHPMVPILHRHRAVALLALGRYREGWEEHEWRWRVHAPMHYTWREFDRPMWDGSDPAGRKILVHSEQGYGDVIQFARYVPMLAAAGAEVILEVPAPVRDLLGSLRCKARIVPKSVKLPDFDLHIPLMSLPRVYKTTIESIPSDIPYLFPADSRMEKFHPIIEQHAAGKLKVGIVWAGNAIPDPRRTVPAKSFFEPFAAVANISWFSLQTGEQRAELKDAPEVMRIIDLAGELKDFADTAAAMSMLDLIITIDTASAHLAGAIGAKTWTLLSAAPDWRWGWEGEATPWYPMMRLFRQRTLGDWSGVLREVQLELTKMTR